jgi:hypothetical protein
MKMKLLLVFVVAWALFLGFTTVPTRHLGESFPVQRIPSEAIMPVSPPLVQYGKDYCLLALDDGTPSAYFDLWNVGDRNAMYLDPADCGGGDIYPFRLDTVVAMFYDFAGVGTVDIRVSVHGAIDGDPCNGPGEQLYLSPPITITTFYPSWVKIPIPYVICLEEPFFLDIQYVKGVPGTIPSLLMDSAPTDTCPLWVYWSPYGYWYNFNSFWEPPSPGEYFLRLIGETGVAGCKYSHLYGDANCDGLVNIADVVYLVNYLFTSGPDPCLSRLGDVNCDKAINIADVVYLVNYLFTSGPEACIPLEILTVNATSPHLADSLDYSKITIEATDSLGNPVLGADIGVTLFMGLDSKLPYETMEKAEGTYIALVPTTLAGLGRIKASDLESGISAATEVEFLPGEVAHLIVVKAEEPRDFLPRETFKTIGVATDPYQNAVSPPYSNIIFETDLGNIDSVVVDEHGDHHAFITSYELGIATITATETNTMLEESFEMVFPAVDLLMPPTSSYGPGDTLQVPVNVFIPDLAQDLGYYDFQITFDPTMLEFLGVEDWDTLDLFPPPVVETIEPGIVRIFQWGIGDYSTDITQLYFECLADSGYSLIDVDLWGHSPLSLTDTYTNPIFPIEVWDYLRGLKLFEVVPTEKPTKTQYLKFWVAPGTFGSQQEAWNKIAADVAKLARIFAQEVEKCCPMFQFYVVVNYLVSTAWGKIDSADSADGKLEEFDNNKTSKTNPTKEESTMLANHHIGGMINAYYVPDLSDGSLGENLAPGGNADSGGVVVDGNDAPDYALSHEVGHLFGLTHKDSTGATVPKGNLMYPTNDSASAAAEKCKALSPWQCGIITANDPKGKE